MTLYYQKIARTWMSADGANSKEFQRRDFANHSLEYLADECMKSWQEWLDRDALIEGLAAHRDWLDQNKEDDQ